MFYEAFNLKTLLAGVCELRECFKGACLFLFHSFCIDNKSHENQRPKSAWSWSHHLIWPLLPNPDSSFTVHRPKFLCPKAAKTGQEVTQFHTVLGLDVHTPVYCNSVCDTTSISNRHLLKQHIYWSGAQSIAPAKLREELINYWL